MTHKFSFVATPGGTELRLLGPSGAMPVDLWALEAPDPLLPGVDLVRQLEAADAAIADGDLVLIDSRAVSALSPRQAAQLGLPALADAVGRIAAKGLVTKPDFHVALEWATPLGQPIVGAERIGAFLRVGRDLRRIPDALFAIAEAIDALNRTNPADAGGRLAALADVRELLPAGIEAGVADATGLVANMKIAVADAFSLDLRGEGNTMKLVPVLHRAHGETEHGLLPPEQQKAFGDEQFNRFSDARSVYALGNQWYIVLQPSLRRALSEVRRVNSSSPATRRAFLANPRAYLRDALGDDADDILLESVFRETRAYADRVLGLGLWTSRVVPWINLQSTDWFGGLGDESGDGGAITGRPKPEGIMVGDRPIKLDPEQAAALRDKIEAAIGAGQSTVPLAVDDATVSIPASHDTLTALAQLELARGARVSTEKADRPAHEVLTIKTNEEVLEAEQGVQASRPAPPKEGPSCLATAMKVHQQQGLDWLQSSWTQGVPGVLLADDMGLGKTLQGLAFLAWLREGMRAGVVDRGPLLIVAPTGLLQNWRAEHDRHLSAPALGACTEAYGRGLARLKRSGGNDRPSLDVEVLRRADWVLTTYETLRDYDRDFGQVRFVAALFDEAQKIKTPAIRLTDAAKAMNVDFRIAMTGTPVENRLADIWCIVDTVQPGWLGDLKSFSAQYERDLDLDRLRTLKGQLERPFGGRPQIMLRRLKQDHLPDLPPVQEAVLSRTMPREQRSAYESAVADARAAREPGAVLKALQGLRAISLHPSPEEAVSDEAFISGSARLESTFAALDKIAGARERALIFLGDLALQARLSGIIQRRYGLPVPPAVINGGVAGAVRQARVDAFQAAPPGFGVMILSPQAGGVGLTLTRANHVIHLSRWWNPAVEDQCTGRAVRIGQTRPVFVHIPMAVLGDGSASFDENLAALLARKRKLMRDTLLPSDATLASDRDELFRSTVG